MDQVSIECPHCHYRHVTVIVKTETVDGVSNYRCATCGKTWPKPVMKEDWIDHWSFQSHHDKYFDKD